MILGFIQDLQSMMVVILQKVIQAWVHNVQSVDVTLIVVRVEWLIC